MLTHGKSLLRVGVMQREELGTSKSNGCLMMINSTGSIYLRCALFRGCKSSGLECSCPPGGRAALARQDSDRPTRAVLTGQASFALLCVQFYFVFTQTEAFGSDSQILVFLNLFWHIFTTHVGRKAILRSVFPLIFGGKTVWLKL